MISRLLSSESKSITGAAIIISAAGLLSDIAGVIRDRILAHNFGAGPVMDSYYAAFKVPDLIYNLLIVGALTAGFIPTFTKIFYRNNNDRANAWQLVNNLINIAGILLIILCGLGIIFTPVLTKIIAPGFSETNLAMATSFARIMFLSPLILGISMVMGGVLQSLRQFVLYSIAPIFYNLGIIIGATLLIHTPLGLLGLPVGVILGALFHAGIQIYGAYQSGYRWKWFLNFKDKDTLLIGKLMIPRTMGVAITQLNTVVITIMASLLPIGSVAVYNYANNLQSVPTGLIGIPFALAVFPFLSQMVGEKNGEGFIKHLAATTRQILFFIIPVSLVTLLLRAQIVRVILGSGAFDWNATIATADALAFFSLGLFAQSLIPLYARAFYALSNTKTPFTLGVIAELIAIIAALLLMKPLGVAGLALASSIGVILNLGMLVIALRQLTGNLEETKMLHLLFRLAIAGLAMAVVIQTLKYPLSNILNLNRFWGILLHGGISGTVGLLVYGGICYLFKVEEMMTFHASLKNRLFSFKNIPAGIDETKTI
ncbi:MAG: murein biosynthesis integral membrane protein MurJ [Candidatus Magasanikbacteria bacterium]|nr:murein biosynthesis integral membrane protein MurJ [Candidatus Magasanikbacteria bacterium]